MNEQLDGLWNAIEKLESRIRGLERENDELRRQISDLEYKLPNLERSLQDEIRRSTPSRGW